MDPLQQLDLLMPVLGAVVNDISSSDLDRPTPCSGYTVRGALEHMIGGATMFAAAFRGAEPREPGATDVLAGFGPAMSELAAAIASPGALERTVAAPFGPVPGEVFARFVALDGLVHGWDLATATGQPYDPPAELVRAVHDFAEATLDPLRDGETFKQATEPRDDETPIGRLAAYTGRITTGGVPR